MIPWWQHDNKITADSNNQWQEIKKWQQVNLFYLGNMGKMGSSVACQKKGQILFCLSKPTSHEVSHGELCYHRQSFTWGTGVPALLTKTSLPTVTLCLVLHCPLQSAWEKGVWVEHGLEAKVFLKPLWTARSRSYDDAEMQKLLC